VATAGLKVVLFSTICRRLVRVAGKGLGEEALKVESSKLKGEKEEKTREVHLGDRWGVTSCKILGLVEGLPPPGFL
jgi:hypothetical protein